MFKNKASWLLFEADKGTETGDATGTNGGDDKPFATFKTEAELQARVDGMLKERLDRAEKVSAEKAKKAAEDAAAKALKDSADFKTLSETQAQSLLEKETDLTQTTAQAQTLTTERDLYKNALENYVKERRKNLPESINALLEKLDPVAQMAWLDKNAEKFGATVILGNGQSPKPAGPAGTAANTEKARAQSMQHARNDF